MNKRNLLVLIVGIVAVSLTAAAFLVFGTGCGNKESLPEETIVEDTTAPVIMLLGDENIFINKGSVYEEPGYTAVDDVDGDLTEKVSVTDDIDVNTVGTYHVTYFVEDAAGNKARERRKITVMETYIDTYDLINFDLRKNYPDVMCPEKEFNQTYYDQTYLVGDSFFKISALNQIGHLDHIWSIEELKPTDITSRTMYVGDTPTDLYLDNLIQMNNPKALVIMYGNCMVFNGNTDFFRSSSIDFYNYLRSAYPDLEVAICSLVPYDIESIYEHIEMWGFERQQRVNEFNVVNCELCRQFGYKYMNVDEVLKNPETGYMYQQYVCDDDYHLTAEGYQVMMDYINTHLGWWE